MPRKKKPKDAGEQVCEACGEMTDNLVQISVGGTKSRKVCDRCFRIASEGGADPGGVRKVAERAVKDVIAEVTPEEHLKLIMERRKTCYETAKALGEGKERLKALKESHEIAISELMCAIDGEAPLPLFDQEADESKEEGEKTDEA